MKAFGRTYVRLMLAGAVTAAGVGALGYYPTVRIAGPSSVGAMAAGIGVSLVAGCIGFLPIGLAAQGDPTRAPQAVLLATLIRFVVVLALAVSLILSGWFDRVVLALWVAISYLVMLLIDTTFAVHLIGQLRGNQRR